MKLKIFSRTIAPVSTKLGLKRPWMKRIQVCSGLSPRGGGIITMYRKNWQNFKIFFSRFTGIISTKLDTKHPWVKGIPVCSNIRNHSNLNNKILGFSSNQRYDIIVCVYWFELFSQESDVAHGSLVCFYIGLPYLARRCTSMRQYVVYIHDLDLWPICG